MMPDGFSFPEEKFLLIGKVIKVHGLQGEVKIYPFSEQPENIRAYKHLVLVSQKGELSVPLKIDQCRVQKNIAVLRLEGVTSREKSEKLVGMGVLIDRKDLPETDDNSYYWHALIGQDVFLNTGEPIGKVDRLFSNGAQDILVVVSKDDEYMIPVTKSIVVNFSGEGLVINPPPGLLDINAETDKQG